MAVTLEGAAPRFAPAPSRAELERQGATFVKLPKALFQDVYALCELEKRGELPAGSKLAEMLEALRGQVQTGALGRPE